jgi:thiol-disulfide isomerase/thioredoxin
MRSIIIVFLFVIAQGVAAQDYKTFEKFAELQEYLDRDTDTTYVVNFWASWCIPCIRELPYFDRLDRSMPDHKIKVMLVSLDLSNQIESRFKPFLLKGEYRSEVILLTDRRYNSWIPLVDESWSGSIPATLLLSGGRQNFAEKEFDSEQDLIEFVYSFINSQ